MLVKSLTKLNDVCNKVSSVQVNPFQYLSNTVSRMFFTPLFVALIFSLVSEKSDDGLLAFFKSVLSIAMIVVMYYHWDYTKTKPAKTKADGINRLFASVVLLTAAAIVVFASVAGGFLSVCSFNNETFGNVIPTVILGLSAYLDYRVVREVYWIMDDLNLYLDKKQTEQE